MCELKPPDGVCFCFCSCSISRLPDSLNSVDISMDTMSGNTHKNTYSYVCCVERGGKVVQLLCEFSFSSPGTLSCRLFSLAPMFPGQKLSPTKAMTMKDYENVSSPDTTHVNANASITIRRSWHDFFPLATAILFCDASYSYLHTTLHVFIFPAPNSRFNPSAYSQSRSRLI